MKMAKHKHEWEFISTSWSTYKFEGERDMFGISLYVCTHCGKEKYRREITKEYYYEPLKPSKDMRKFNQMMNKLTNLRIKLFGL